MHLLQTILILNCIIGNKIWLIHSLKCIINEFFGSNHVWLRFRQNTNCLSSVTETNEEFWIICISCQSWFLNELYLAPRYRCLLQPVKLDSEYKMKIIYKNSSTFVESKGVNWTNFTFSKLLNIIWYYAVIIN
jgi:hypothetical protein